METNTAIMLGIIAGMMIGFGFIAGYIEGFKKCEEEIKKIINLK